MRKRCVEMIAIGAVVLFGSATAAAAAETAEEGRLLFSSQVSHIGRKYTESELARWLRDPAVQKPRAHMPRLALQEDEIRALAAYLATLR